MLLMMAI